MALLVVIQVEEWQGAHSDIKEYIMVALYLGKL